jgi:hypothetical protein
MRADGGYWPLPGEYSLGNASPSLPLVFERALTLDNPKNRCGGYGQRRWCIPMNDSRWFVTEGKNYLALNISTL